GLVGCQDDRAHLLPRQGMCALLFEGAANDDSLAGVELDSRCAPAAFVPLDKVAGAGRELATGAAHPDTPVDRPPEGAVDQADLAPGLWPNLQADRISALPAADEFAVGDQKP